jgi:lipopolysaccharide/colanic/teichoic acid biosynthesis glycosyltransferase
MSSVSVENVFPPKTGGEAGQPGGAGSALQSKRLPPHWSHALHASFTGTNGVGGASHWVLSGSRRCLDFLVALAALIAFLPFILLAAALVGFGSKGPVFFRQRRMGRSGREFTLYKFRSMRPADSSGSCITVKGDSRITPVGAFLRRYKLDELPQFWNVLRGDMALVGPRPKLPHHEALHLACRPGITGAATLAFRREEEFLSGVPEHELEAFYEIFVKPAKARLDLDYMRTATPVSDLAVLWRTASCCLFASEESLSRLAEIVARYAEERSAPSSVPVSVASSSAVMPVESAETGSEL